MSSSEDDIILSYHDVVLRQSEISILTSRTDWITDTLLEFFYEYLEKHHPTQHSHCLFLRPAMVQLLTFLSPEETRTALPPFTPTQELVFLPINNSTSFTTIGGSHWALVIYSRKTNGFYYYDSIADSMISRAKTVVEKFSKAYLNTTQDPVFKTVPTPEQMNNYDCGMYVLMFTKHFVELVVEYREKEVSVEEYERVFMDSIGTLGIAQKEFSQRAKVFRKELLELIFKLRDEHETI